MINKKYLFLQYDKLGSKSFTCSTCGKQFHTNWQFGRHILIHTGQKPYSCSYCDYASTQKGNLNTHIVKYHNKTVFNKFWSIKYLFLQYYKLGSKSFACSTCGKQFQTKKDIGRHILIHTGQKPFSCSYCDYASTQKGNLNTHIFRYHNETLKSV